MPIEAEAYQELEAVEAEAESEAAEATPFRRPSSRPSYVPRSFGPTPAVSQGQLQAALNRVDQKVATLASTEASINSRVNAVSAANKKETADRKKAMDSQLKDLSQKVQLLALLPLLVTQPSVTVKAGTLLDSNSQPIPQVSTPDTSKLDAILPLLLVSGGLGGTSGTGGYGLGGDSGSDSSFLLLALVLAFSGK